MPITLSRAIGIACTLQARLEPLCERIQIAGSIRRARPMVNDIDFVILPKDKAAIQARFAACCATVQTGPQNCIYRRHLSDKETLQIDIFFAKPATRDLLTAFPSNYGSLLLCRTGSRAHNIHLIAHAKKLGLRWDPYQGVFDAHDNLIASETEESIFQALQHDYIAPENREYATPPL